MKKIIFLIPLLFVNVGCDKINALVEMPSTLDSMSSTTKGMAQTTSEMNAGMGKTNAGIHNQTMKLADDGLNDKNNWDELNPAPFKLMKYGKAFAEEASVDELMLYFQDTLKELNEAKLDLGQNLQTGDTLPYIAGSQELTNVMQEKMVKVTILSIIAGFAPQDLDKDPANPKKDTVGEIIAREINSSKLKSAGNFRAEAQAFLALRAKFINDIFLANLDLAGPLSNIGKVEYAIEDARKLDFVAKLTRPDQIKAIVKPQLHVAEKAGDKPAPMDLDMTTAVDPTQALAVWKSIRTGIDKDLAVGQASAGAVSASAADLKNEQQRAQAASQVVNQYLSTWAPAASK